MTRPLNVRGRVEPGADGAPERLFDPLSRGLVAGDPFSRERFATLWSDTAALRSLAEAKRGGLPADLAEALAGEHRRLGAPAASLRALEALSRGEAVCAVCGQQPSPLGGPLYSLHKTASTVGLAERITARTGIPCVPLYWTHAEDSDFDEIRSVTVADIALQLHELALAAEHRVEGGLVGHIPIEAVASVGRDALAHWVDMPHRGSVTTLWNESIASARDLGDAQSALMLRLFGERGLVVVDPRLDAFRSAARPIIDRYLSRAEALGEAARRAGERLEARIGRRPLADASLDSFVFAIRGTSRHKVSIDEARGLGRDAVLSPSVALRPAVQDGVLPTVAMACGPGEIAYLAQLREVFEGVGVRPAAPVPRLSATWIPPAAGGLMDAAGGDPWAVVSDTDAVLKRLSEARVPAAPREALDEARRASFDGLARFAELSTSVDPSLPQMVESARGKVDYQFARLLEGLTGKVRHKLDREHPQWSRLRYYLSPGGRTQERTLAALEPAAYLGTGITAALCDLAVEQSEALERGIMRHYLLNL